MHLDANIAGHVEGFPREMHEVWVRALSPIGFMYCIKVYKNQLNVGIPFPYGTYGSLLDPCMETG